MFCKIFATLKVKIFRDVIALVTKALCFITQFLITLSGTIISLTIELYHSVKPLIKKFLRLITCRGKPRFVLNGCSSYVLVCGIFIAKLFFNLSLTLCNEKILAQNSMINRFDYGVQICSIHASSSFTQKNTALKKQVEKYFVNETDVDKPFSVKKYVVSCGFALPRLRRRCNGVSLGAGRTHCKVSRSRHIDWHYFFSPLLGSLLPICLVML